MSADRINYARRLAASLKNDYDTSNIAGLRRIAADNRIIVIESPEVIGPEVSFAYPRPVIFIGKSERFMSVAHELGHALIPGHERSVGFWKREIEATLFSYELASRNQRLRHPVELLRDILKLCLFKPHGLVRYHWSSITNSHNAYLYKIYSKNIDGYYNNDNN